LVQHGASKIPFGKGGVRGGLFAKLKPSFPKGALEPWFPEKIEMLLGN